MVLYRGATVPAKTGKKQLAIPASRSVKFVSSHRSPADPLPSADDITRRDYLVGERRRVGCMPSDRLDAQIKTARPEWTVTGHNRTMRANRPDQETG